MIRYGTTLAVLLIAAALTGCADSGAGRNRIAATSSAVDDYGSSTAPEGLFDTAADPYHIGRDSARRSF